MPTSLSVCRPSVAARCIFLVFTFGWYSGGTVLEAGGSVGIADSLVETFHQELFEPDPDLPPESVLQHWISMGEVRVDSVDPEGALVAFTAALNVARELPDPMMEAELHLRMGRLYLSTDRGVEAQDLFTEAERLFERLGNVEGQLKVAVERAKLLRKQGDVVSSVQAFEQVIDEAREVGGNHLLVSSINNLGELLVELGEFDRALQLFNQVIESADTGISQSERVRAYANRADLYYQRGDYSLASLSAQAVIDMARRAGEEEVVVSAYLLLSNTHAAAGNYRQALQAYRNHSNWANGIRTQAHEEQLRNLRGQYIASMQAREIEMERRHTLLESAAQAETEWNLQRQSIQRTLSLVGLFLLLFVSIVFYFEARFRRRAHHEQQRLNRELSEALKRAEEASDKALQADKAKTQFLANMSHEIRTPLNAVIGMASILQDTRLDDEQEGYLQAIQTSGNSLLSLLNDLLDFSKIESGRLDLEHVSFDLAEVVDEVMDIFRSAAARKKLELASQIDASVPTYLLGDPARLRQILLNLVGNAVKFTDKGEVVLVVQPRSKILAGQVIHFQVRDTGIGIAEDRLDSLFQPFTQADNSHTRKYGGTGLGLSISRRLCELMEGEMWVESAEREGTVFHLTLPFKLDPVPPKGDEVYRELNGRRILILDDNPNNRRVLSSYCEQAGMEITQSDGLDPLPALISDAKPELVLVDCQMSDSSGLAIARSIRSEQGRRRLPFVFLSSVADSSLRSEAFAMGDADYIIKPVKRERLYRSMLRLLSAESRDVVATKGPSMTLDGTDGDHNEGGIDLSKIDPNCLRILLVEDNRINQRVATILLKKMGHNVQVASDGREALDWITSNGAVDVVLMDLQMPEMDGIEATRQIREKLPQSKQPLIFAMTAATQVEDEANCRKVGMDGFLTKPVKPAALKSVLNNILVRNR